MIKLIKAKRKGGEGLNDTVVVVGFDTARRIRAVSKVCHYLAESTAAQLRQNPQNKSVKRMDEDEFSELLDREMGERRKWNMIQ